MASLNQINLIGRVGHTPEIKIAGQTTICNFTLAVNEFSKTDSGWTEQPEWFRCNAYNKTAESIKDRVKKGSQIYVSGKMRSRKYTGRDGVERTAWEVFVNNVVMLDKGEDEQTTGIQTQTPPETKPAEKPAPKPEPKPKQMKIEEPKEPIKFPEPEDDELPF